MPIETRARSNAGPVPERDSHASAPAGSFHAHVPTECSSARSRARPGSSFSAHATASEGADRAHVAMTGTRAWIIRSEPAFFSAHSAARSGCSSAKRGAMRATAPWRRRSSEMPSAHATSELTPRRAKASITESSERPRASP